LLQTDAEASAMTQGLVSRFKDPQHRIREVQPNALGATAAGWSKLLDLRLLDRISISRDYGPNTISQQLLIQQISLDIRSDPPAWDQRLVTSPALTEVTQVCEVDFGLVGTHKTAW
jgi:hypothetical protein